MRLWEEVWKDSVVLFDFFSLIRFHGFFRKTRLPPLKIPRPQLRGDGQVSLVGKYYKFVTGRREIFRTDFFSFLIFLSSRATTFSLACVTRFVITHVVDDVLRVCCQTRNSESGDPCMEMTDWSRLPGLSSCSGLRGFFPELRRASLGCLICFWWFSHRDDLAFRNAYFLQKKKKRTKISHTTIFVFHISVSVGLLTVSYNPTVKNCSIYRLFS